jgi:hypothetical protein
MKLTSAVTDNVEELLTKIIEFTEAREKVLTENLKNFSMENFVPRDLPVEEFAMAIDIAIGEHVKNDRLAFLDSDNLKFGSHGSFITSLIIDKDAKKLFEKNIDEYLKLQAKKMAENKLNSVLANEMLRHKQLCCSAMNNKDRY